MDEGRIVFATRQPLLLGASRLIEDGSLANGALYLDESGVQMLDKTGVWPIEQSYAQGALMVYQDEVWPCACADLCRSLIRGLSSVSRPSLSVLIVLADASRLPEVDW